MKRFNLNFLAVAAIAVSVAFTSCDKDKDKDEELVSSAFDGKITVKVHNGEKYNDVFKTVRLTEYDDNGKAFIIASGEYSNGGFTLNFVKTVPDKFLRVQAFSGDIKTSNSKVKFYGADDDVEGYDAEGKFVDSFSYHTDYSKNDFSAYAFFMYVDDDLTVTGTQNMEELRVKYELSLKKGWNIVYSYESEEKKEGGLTTKAIDGLKWYRDDDN